MEKMKRRKMKVIILLVLFFEVWQAAFPQKHKEASDIKWTGRDTGISKLIDNNGCYTNGRDYYSFIFYDDGTLVTCRAPSDTLNRFVTPWPPRAHFHRNCWRAGTTGVYRIEGDTIYANSYFCDYLFFLEIYGRMNTFKFHILDRRTIVWDSDLSRFWAGDTISSKTNMNDTLYFERYDNLPPPNTKWKHKKWLWDNKGVGKKLFKNNQGDKKTD